MLIWYFSNNLDIYYYVGKLPQQHFSVWLFWNPGDKILSLLKFDEARISEWNLFRIYPALTLSVEFFWLLCVSQMKFETTIFPLNSHIMQTGDHKIAQSVRLVALKAKRAIATATSKVTATATATVVSKSTAKANCKGQRPSIY